MRKRVCFGFLAMCLYVSLAATAGSAQSNRMLVANVPFDFQVGGKILPAGAYSVRQITTSGAGLLIRNEEGREAIMVLSNSAQENKSAQSRLVFHRYGDQYFLATVWGPEGAGREILESRRERSLRKEMRIAQRAGLAPQRMQVVTIAARYAAAD